MAKTMLVRASGACEAHPRLGYKVVVDEGEWRKRYHGPHRHPSEDAASNCLDSVLENVGAQ